MGEGEGEEVGIGGRGRSLTSVCILIHGSSQPFVRQNARSAVSPITAPSAWPGNLPPDLLVYGKSVARNTGNGGLMALDA